MEVARGVQRVRFFVTPSGELRERAVSPPKPESDRLSISTSILNSFGFALSNYEIFAKRARLFCAYLYVQLASSPPNVRVEEGRGEGGG